MLDPDVERRNLIWGLDALRDLPRPAGRTVAVALIYVALD